MPVYICMSGNIVGLGTYIPFFVGEIAPGLFPRFFRSKSAFHRLTRPIKHLISGRGGLNPKLTLFTGSLD